MQFECIFSWSWGTPSGKTPPQSLRDSSPKGTPFGAAAKFLIASETLTMMLAACALSVKAYGFASSPKGRAKCTAGNFLIEPNTLASRLTAWLSL